MLGVTVADLGGGDLVDIGGTVVEQHDEAEAAASAGQKASDNAWMCHHGQIRYWLFSLENQAIFRNLGQFLRANIPKNLIIYSTKCCGADCF